MNRAPLSGLWVAGFAQTRPRPGRLLPGMLDDPGPELHSEAVAAVVTRAEKERGKGDPTAAMATLRRAVPPPGTATRSRRSSPPWESRA